MRRREFIAGLSGAAMWPLVANAQRSERMRRVGMLTGIADDDAQNEARNVAFLQELQKLGWTEGRNVRIEMRAGAGNPATIRKYAAELVALEPDVIVGSGATPVGLLLEATHTVPIVFAAVVDPMGAGFIEKLSRPGGNATGFMEFDYSLSGKWLELLKQVAPSVMQVAVLRDTSSSASSAGVGQFAVIQAVAPSLGVEVSTINAGDVRQMDRALAAFERESNVGIIVTAGAATVVHRDVIISLAARYKLPAIYFERTYIADGGLISYGPNVVAQFRQAASYVDRILKGEKPADLPVQAPTKYELVINLKTAKALGITVPQSLLSRADEVIE